MQNLRSIAFMTLAMAGFAIEDSLIKALTFELPIAQILISLGLGGTLVFTGLALINKHQFFPPDLLSWPFMIRFFSETLAAFFFLLAIAMIPLSTASTILQSVPILVTAGAAVFLGQTVGPRRWGAILFGFSGVVLVIQPGIDGFHWGSVLAFIGAIFLASRDLSTRVMNPNLPTLVVATYGFFAALLAGVMMVPLSTPFIMPTVAQWLQIMAIVFFGVIAYAAIVASTRTGDLAAVAPFRYSRLIFVLIISVVVLGESPDLITIIGAVIIVSSGLYSFLRERRLAHLDAINNGH